MTRDGATQIVAEFLVHVAQRRWNRHSTTHRETQTVRLPSSVVRILTEDHDLHIVVRREMKRGEHVLGRRIHRPSASFVGHEGLEFEPIGLIELIPKQWVPVGRGHDVIVVHSKAGSPTA